MNREEPGAHRKWMLPYPYDALLLKFGLYGGSLPVRMVDWPFETTRAVAGLPLTGALQRFPNIRFILSHASGAVPYFAWRLAMFQERQGVPLANIAAHGDEMLTHRFNRSPLEEVARGLTLLRRLSFDIACSATPFAFPSLLALVPPSHVLFGTDLAAAAEFVAAETIRGVAEEIALSDDARRAVERDRALAHFPRLAAA